MALLENLQRIPGVEGERRPQHRRQIIRLAQDSAPLLQPRLLVPVEIVDQRISVRGRFTHGGFYCRQRRFRARRQRIDRRHFRGQGDVVSRSLPFPDRIFARLTRRQCPGRWDVVAADGTAGGWDIVGDRANITDYVTAAATQAAQAIRTECLAWRLRSDPPPRAQHVMGDGQVVRRGTDVGTGVVEDEILEMYEFTVDPQ